MDTIKTTSGARAGDGNSLALLIEVVEDYLEAQGALDNRELLGPNAPTYEELRRECNKAYAVLDAALHVAKISAASAATPLTDAQIDAIGYQSDGPDDLKSCLDLIGKIAAAETNGDALSAVMDFRKAQRMEAARAALDATPAVSAPVGWKFECAGDVIKAIAPDGTYWCVVRDDLAREDKIGAFFWTLCDALATRAEAEMPCAVTAQGEQP